MNIIIAIVLFSVLILFHEFGHFLLAKLNHIHVYEFSLGLGPTLVGFHIGETKYCLKLLPFGGACAMGEDDEFDEKDPGAFNNKSVWARMSVVAAGPVFNFILALIFAFVIICIAGYDEPYVVAVESNSPAYEAGIQPGDKIIELNNKKMYLSREVTLVQSLHPDEELQIVYEREEDGATVVKEAVVMPYERDVYQIGIVMESSAAAKVESFAEGSPAEAAGMQVGDVIHMVNGTEVKLAADVSTTLQSCDGEMVEVQVLRGEETVSLKIEPNHISGYYSGLTLNPNYRTEGSLLQNLKYSWFELKYWIETTFETLKMLVTGQVGLNDLSGPVGIVDTIGTTYEQSKSSGAKYVWLNMLNMAILLSANLGVMNLLPIPALDGGRLLFFVIEAIRGKRISAEKEGLVHFIGFVLLMLLMVVVLLNDVRKIFF